MKTVELATSKCGDKRKLIETKENGEGGKTDTKAWNSVPNYRVARLPPSKIENMMNRKVGYVHVFPNNYVVPYCLPLDRQLLVCPCSRIFNDRSGQQARNHIMKCKEAKPYGEGKRDGRENTDLRKIAYTSGEYADLEGNPQFCYSRIHGGQMGIRMHPRDLAIICVCGKVMSYTNCYSKHMKDCKYLNSVMRDNERIERIPNDGIPTVKVVSNVMADIEPTLVNNAKTPTAGDPTYASYSVVGIGEVGMNVFMPVGDKFLNSKIGEIVTQLDADICSLWSDVFNVYDETKVRNHWKSNEMGNGRYYMKLETGELGCWDNFCTNAGYNKETKRKITSQLISFARSKTKQIIGKKEYGTGRMTLPTLVMCETEANEELSVRYNEYGIRKHFSLILSEGVSSAEVCMFDKHVSLTSIYSVLKLLSDSTDFIDNGEWMKPNGHFFSQIRNIDGDLSIARQIKKKLQAGCGTVFRINKLNQEAGNHDAVRYTSSIISDCNTGTLYVIDGEVVHAESGSCNRCIRTVMSWTWEKNQDENSPWIINSIPHTEVPKEETVKTETKFSLVVQIARECWESLSTKENKLDMMRMMYSGYLMTERGYRNDIIQTRFTGQLRKFFQSLDSVSSSAQCEKIFEDYLNMFENA